MQPPKKTTFPPELCNEICTIYVSTIKKDYIVPFQNGGQITNFASFDFDQDLKNHFPKGIFQLILAPNETA